MALIVLILLVTSSISRSNGYLVGESKNGIDIQQLFHHDPLVMKESSLGATGRAGIFDGDRCNFNIKGILFWLGLKALALTLWFLRPREKYKPEYHEGSYGGYDTGRGSGARGFDGHGFFLSNSEEEGGRCFMMYTQGDKKQLTCMKRLACQDPDLALDYVEAARMFNVAHKFSSFFPYDSANTLVFDAMEEAAMDSIGSGGNCSEYRW